MTYIKTFGIYRTFNGKYAVATEISDDKKYYHLADIVDFEENHGGDFTYYALLKRTTNPEKVSRLGRLIFFGEHNWWSMDYKPANVKNEKINWMSGLLLT